jgi:hypothetical protein
MRWRGREGQEGERAWSVKFKEDDGDGEEGRAKEENETRRVYISETETGELYDII